jgi:NAD(P)-dependent dehydrogenase (short-subunit alcohol dehydrogenase family)
VGYADTLFDLTGRVALITGGSRGLGREMAFGLARCGADVVIASRNHDSCAATAKEIEDETGRAALPYGVHVGRWDGRRELRAVRQGRRSDQQRGYVAGL